MTWPQYESKGVQAGGECGVPHITAEHSEQQGLIPSSGIRQLAKDKSEKGCSSRSSNSVEDR